MHIWKGHGTENDFVLVPDHDGLLTFTPPLVAALCDRRRGVGADGVLRVVRFAADAEAASYADATDAPDWFMDYRNADGSIAEMCGNGIRVVGRYLVEAGLAPPGRIRLATRAGVKELDVPPVGDVTVDMGRYELIDGAYEVEVAGARRAGRGVSMGNPHVVVAVASLAEPGVLTDEPQVTPPFADGVNVEYVVREGERLSMRVYERGVGETRSCGTGACAVAVAAALDDGAEQAAYDVRVPGGRLDVVVRGDCHVLLRGPAVLVAEGELTKQWLGAVTA